MWRVCRIRGFPGIGNRGAVEIITFNIYGKPQALKTEILVLILD
jgi:hypothetical protein